MSDESQARMTMAKKLKDGIERRKRKAESSLAAPTGSADYAVVEIIQGVEGPCVAINERRVAGPKPWGGGKVIMRWKTTRARIMESLSLPNVQAQAQTPGRDDGKANQ